MNRRARNAILSLAVAASTGTAGPITHAGAYSRVGTFHCFGTGQATLGRGLAYFPNATFNVDHTFTFNCLHGGSITGFGMLESASCGRSYGNVTIIGVGTFEVETAGSMLFVLREGSVVISLGNATPIPDTSTIPFGNTCSNGTARTFQLSGGMMCVDTNDGAVCNSLRRQLGDPAGDEAA